MFPLLVAIELIAVIVTLNTGRLIILIWEILGELWGGRLHQTVAFDLIVFLLRRKILEGEWPDQNSLKGGWIPHLNLVSNCNSSRRKILRDINKRWEKVSHRTEPGSLLAM